MQIMTDVLSADEIQMANIKEGDIYQDPGFEPVVYWDGTPDIVLESDVILEDPGAVLNPPILQEYPATVSDEPILTSPPISQDEAPGTTVVVEEEKKSGNGLLILLGLGLLIVIAK